MSITDSEDDSVIAAVQRWHIFNRDPSDQHWQNIDTLLHKLDHHEQDVEDAVSSRCNDFRHEIKVLEQQLDDKDALIDKRDGEIERLELELHEETERYAKLSKAADELDTARVNHALKVEAELARANRKLRALTLFAETCARERDGEIGVTKIRAVLEKIDNQTTTPLV